MAVEISEFFNSSFFWVTSLNAAFSLKQGHGFSFFRDYFVLLHFSLPILCSAILNIIKFLTFFVFLCIILYKNTNLYVDTSYEKGARKKMACENVQECSCPKIDCERHKKCCVCIKSHRERGYLPHCLRPVEPAETPQAAAEEMGNG